jgi:hypothetical protein
MPGLDEKRKEWFSRAFLIAVAVVAGFKVEWQLDDVDGVDGCLKDGGVSTDWQLKSTAHPKYDGEDLMFDLDVVTYNKLRVARTAEAYLGVVVLPTDRRKDWLHHCSDSLTLYKTGYWLKLSGMKATTNTSRIRLRIPAANRLDSAQVRQIMSAARKRVEQ